MSLKKKHSQEKTKIIECLSALLASPTLMDSSHFWNDVNDVAVPLITARSNKDNVREVTFLWRSEKPLLGVYIRLNRVTDKKDVDKGMMVHVPDSDIWWLTLELDATYRGSYTIVEIPPLTPPEKISQLGSRFAPIIGQSDPLNKMADINIRGFNESVLALDLAPEQSEWETVNSYSHGVLATSCPLVAGHHRRVRLYIPDTPKSEPLGLLVLPDAETWFDHIGIIDAIEAAIHNRRISPVAILGIDNLDESDRNSILGGHTALIQDISRYLIPLLRMDNPDRIWAGRSKTVLAGQSLGGVTALMAALHAPETFGHVISHSPSMWWTPDSNSRPFLFTEHDYSWISDYLLAAPPKKVTIQLCVGSLEGATVPHIQTLHKKLMAVNVKSELMIYTGGHDYAWWRGALIEGLSRL